MKSVKEYPYYPDAQVVCACGTTFTTGSTKKTIQVDICSKCHPFFTGEQKFVDTQGRVEKFVNRREQAAKTKKPSKKNRSVSTDSSEQKTLKEMLQKVK